MKQTFAILKATALEILSEPLSLLILLAALVLAVLAPAFHYHQFGEATRMARDAGFSALFTGGTVWSVFTTIRAFRREIESGTLEMALAHPISRARFFLVKACGAFAAYLVFFLVLFSTMLMIVWGAAVGGRLAERTGDIARLFGPALAAGVLVILLPLLIAAALNRFARFRFVLSSIVLALVLALLAAVTVTCLGGIAFAGRYLAAVLPLAAFSAVLVAAASAFAIRFKANAAASSALVVLAVGVPFLGNYYFSESLANGGVVSAGLVLGALGAVIPAVAAFLLLGIHFGERIE